MLKIVCTVFCLLITCVASAQNNNQQPQIKRYWFVMLMAGQNRTQDSASAAKIQEGHMANITKMHQMGKLKVAGPFGDNGPWRGIFILDCETQEEAEKLIREDPAIIAGRLSYEIHPWYTMPTGSFLPGKPDPVKKE